MPALKAELWLLIRFLRAQIPRLHQARFESHKVGLKRSVVWVAAIQSALVWVSVLTHAYGFSGFFNFFASLISLIAVGIVSGLIFAFLFTLWTGASGAWIQYKRKALDWNDWFEFNFLCALPLFGSTFLSNFFPVLTWPLSIAALGYAVYLFYTGIKLRFSLPSVRDYSILKGALALLVLLSLGSQWRTRAQLNQMGLDFHLPTSSAETENPYGAIPPIKIATVRALYTDQKNKQNAAEQYAKALWAFLAPKDLVSAREQADRAVQCARRNGLEREDRMLIESIILDTARLTRMYLETDNRFSGRVMRPENYGPAACDF
jgi:hypothetical protein